MKNLMPFDVGFVEDGSPTSSGCDVLVLSPRNMGKLVARNCQGSDYLVIIRSIT